MAWIPTVIPGRAKREPGIHKHGKQYGFRVCAVGANAERSLPERIPE
jgi:hypothetical protein